MTTAFHLMTWNNKAQRRLSIEEFALLREDYSKAKKQYWDSLPASEIELHRKRSNPWASKSSSEIEEYKEKLRIKSTQQPRTKWSADQKEKHSARMREWAKEKQFGSASKTRIQSYKNTVSRRTTEDRAKLKYGTNKGSMWINNGTTSKRLPGGTEIPNGWVPGRLT